MSDIFSFINTMNKIQDTVLPPAIRLMGEQYSAIQNVIEVPVAVQQLSNNYNGMYAAINTLSQSLGEKLNTDGMVTALSSMKYLTSSFYQQQQVLSNLTSALQPILDGYTILGIHPEDRDQQEKEEIDQISEKIISEIYLPDEKKTITDESPSIIIMPANNEVYSYLTKHPEEIYHSFSPREFEEFMAQLYSRLGYNVELTKATRDGGKDIILRKPDILGDMVYYVECKQYDKKNKVGIDVVQRLTGVIETDKVNGGIIATTSFISPDARRWIMNNNLNFRIYMHDFNTIQAMLKKL